MYNPNWSKAQIQSIFQAQEKYGNCWYKIAEEIYNQHNFIVRTQNSLKNIFYSVIRSNIRKIVKDCEFRHHSQCLVNIQLIKPLILCQLMKIGKSQNLDFNSHLTSIEREKAIKFCQILYMRIHENQLPYKLNKSLAMSFAKLLKERSDYYRSKKEESKSKEREQAMKIDQTWGGSIQYLSEDSRKQMRDISRWGVPVIPCILIFK